MNSSQLSESVDPQLHNDTTFVNRVGLPTKNKDKDEELQTFPYM